MNVLHYLFFKSRRNRINALFILLLLAVITVSYVRIARATAPNPGHLFSETDVNIVTKISGATLLATETTVLADGTSGAFTLTLPTAAAAAPHTIYFFEKIDPALANLITITRAGSDTIDGLASVQLTQRGETLMLEADGVSTWRVLNRINYDLSTFRSKGSTLNQWYTSPTNGTAFTTGAPTINNLRAIPFIVTKISTIDQMAINVKTAGVASNSRIGIYADTGNMYPGALVVDTGSISTTVAGVKTYTTGLPATINPGLYWFAYNSDGSTPATVQAFVLAGLNPILGSASTLPTNQQFGWSVALALAALPATFTPGGVPITAVPVPAVYARISQ